MTTMLSRKATSGHHKSCRAERVKQHEEYTWIAEDCTARAVRKSCEKELQNWERHVKKELQKLCPPPKQ